MADLLTIQNYIGGRFEDTPRHMDSWEPSTGAVWAQVPDSTAEDVGRAVSAAREAFPSWSRTPVAERSRLLMRVAQLVDDRLDEFARAESRDQGKPVSLARRMDIPRASHNLRFFASAALHHLDTSTVQPEMGAVNYTMREPVGVAGLISPWNLPLYLLTFKLAPALAYGNTVVCKPSEFTSVTAWMLCQVCKEAGLPDGVLNMVCGGGLVGNALVTHPDVRLVSFTGSTVTGSHIRAACSSQCKRLSMELGGKNAAIVFQDANLDKCIPELTRAAFTNQGEVCLCTERIYVQRPIFDNFLNKFVESARLLRVGAPDDAATDIGALVSQQHMDKVCGCIKRAVTEGVTVACGLGVDNLQLPTHIAKGYFVPPTVLVGAGPKSAIVMDEVFGPLTCVLPFDTEAEVVAYNNSVEYGLCASVWSQDIGTVHRVARDLEVATVWANCWMVRDLRMPFGGVKASGEGREGQEYSVNFYTEAKTVCIRIT